METQERKKREGGLHPHRVAHRHCGGGYLRPLRSVGIGGLIDNGSTLGMPRLFDDGEGRHGIALLEHAGRRVPASSFADLMGTTGDRSLDVLTSVANLTPQTPTGKT